MTEITASAPGSIMLMGEHAVLHGQLALVSAVNTYVHVSVSHRSDDQIFIDCQFGQYQTSIKHCLAKSPFDVVMAAIANFQQQLPMGFNLSIDSSRMPTAKGIGSSTAVTVATTAALLKWLHGHCDLDQCFSLSLQAMRHQQGSCSGADVAASVYGGVLAYCPMPFQLTPLSWQPEWVVLYTGAKMKTAKVVEHVHKRFADQPKKLQAIYQGIGQDVQQATAALRGGDLEALYAAIKQNQLHMQQLGLCNLAIEQILAYFSSQPGIQAAKISGAGLGDCVIGFGHLDKWPCPYERISIQPSQQGVHVENVD